MGDRLHSIYVAAAPKHGKATFIIETARSPLITGAFPTRTGRLIESKLPAEEAVLEALATFLVASSATDQPLLQSAGAEVGELAHGMGVGRGFDVALFLKAYELGDGD